MSETPPPPAPRDPEPAAPTQPAAESRQVGAHQVDPSVPSAEKADVPGLTNAVRDLVSVVTTVLSGKKAKRRTVGTLLLGGLYFVVKWLFAGLSPEAIRDRHNARQTSDSTIAVQIGTLSAPDSGLNTSTLNGLKQLFHYNPVLAEQARPALVQFVAAAAPKAVSGEPCEKPNDHVQHALTLALTRRVHRPFPWMRKVEVGRADGRWSLEEISFANLALDSLDLRKLDLDRACLSGASLRGALLDSASLVRARLDSANLTGASLRHANLTRAILSNAVFDSAILDSVVLSKALIDGVRFTKAQMRGAQLDSVQGVRVDFNEAQLTYANLQRAIIPDAVFDYALASCVSFAGARLRTASFAGTHLTWSDFDDARLGEVHYWPGGGSGSIDSVYLGSAVLAPALRARSLRDGAATMKKVDWLSARVPQFEPGSACDQEARENPGFEEPA